MLPGEVGFRATREATVNGQTTSITLDVAELWLPGDDPSGDWKLASEGCHVAILGWHAQVGATTGARGAERLDVGWEDLRHPRIHRHSYGEVNDVRSPAELPVAVGWLSQLNELLDGALDDGLDTALADEEDEADGEDDAW